MEKNAATRLILKGRYFAFFIYHLLYKNKKVVQDIPWLTNNVNKSVNKPRVALLFIYRIMLEIMVQKQQQIL